MATTLAKTDQIQTTRKRGTNTSQRFALSQLLLIAFLVVITTLYHNQAAAEATLKLPPPSDKYLPNETDANKLGTNDRGIGLTPGVQVPSFSLLNHKGTPTALSDLLEQAPLLLVFYRGGWCPYCNMQIRQLTQAWPEFKARNFTPVLISADAVDAAALTSNAYEIPFPVLSDPELTAHTAFKVILEIDDETYQKYLKYGIDLEKWSGQKHHKIAVPSIFIIDSDATVRWAHTSKDYSVRPSPTQLLSVIDQWQKN